MDTTKTTFKDLYLREKAKPTPAQVFISEIAELTRRSAATVRAWISGCQVPDDLAKLQIAKRYGIDINDLFPKD